MKTDPKYTGLEIAITGISCRVPGANNWREYWDNLVNGIESTHLMSPSELVAIGITEDIIRDERYVAVIPGLKEKELFDASFFDYTPLEAALMNPVHRFFHQCAWEALEDAGYDIERMKGPIGIYAGAGDDSNWRLYSMLKNRDGGMDEFSLNCISNKDSLASLLSYKLNIKGPVISVNTTCSTSLVAINLACKSLLLGEADVALAGGITFRTERQLGNFHVEGFILSADGHCRAFDAAASGTVPTEGAGVVVLKRLNMAIEDGDQIYAIIKGGAINNDGNRKVGFTATSVEGQADCIRKAHKFARVTPGTITYVEAHGTGTRLGDPIELEALNIAFNQNKDHKCAIGSVKTNIGHLDTAAGVAGLIKTALCLKYRQLPASLHFREANPEIDFSSGPFYVNTELKEWERRGDEPLRAGVSSFGIGGTNAHAILEEAPEQEQRDEGRRWKLLIVSARTGESVSRYLESLRSFIGREGETNLADLCYTLQVGRKEFGYRQFMVFRDREELLGLLGAGGKKGEMVRVGERRGSVVLMFPGQGSQYAMMSKGLYATEGIFREQMDKGFAVLESLSGERYKEVLFGMPAVAGRADAAGSMSMGEKINETQYAQVLLFLVEYSLAILLESIGIRAEYMIGHSIGEYVAACLSGVWSFEDALRVVVKRGEVMSRVGPGAMVSLPVSAAGAEAYLGEKLWLAAVNGPQQVVLSGEWDAIEALMERLDGEGMTYVRLHTTQAFHCGMQDPVLSAFREELERIPFGKMGVPFISNLTGEFIREQEACSVDYWVRHLREPVRFWQGLQTVLSRERELIFIEAGAGHSLTSLLKQQNGGEGVMAVNLVRSVREGGEDGQYLSEQLGRLWSRGVPVDWNGYYGKEQRRRISLPTYCFEQVKYPAEVDPLNGWPDNDLAGTAGRSSGINDFFYRVLWKQSVWLPGNGRNYRNSQVLIFSDKQGLGDCLFEMLTNAGAHCIVVEAGTDCGWTANDHYQITPGQEEDYRRLFRDLAIAGIVPSHIIHTWNYGPPECAACSDMELSALYRETGYQSLLEIVRNYSDAFGSAPLNVWAIGSGWYKVLGDELIYPAKSIILAAIKTIPEEFSNISCRAIDITGLSPASVNALVLELKYITEANEIAIRGNKRFVKDFEKIDFEWPVGNTVFRKEATYLITGANGGLGSLFAGFLAERYRANLILLGRNKIRQELIDSLVAKGSRVIAVQADIADVGTTAEQLAGAERSLGSIRGIIHAAGLADHAGMILRRSRQADDQVFAPKIAGSNTLKKLFGGRPLDFMVNCSSGAASMAPFGQIAYVASNIYLDSFAENASCAFPVISIEWPPIRKIGMAVNSISHLSAEEQAAYLKYGINPSEAIHILSTALYLGIPVQVISRRDFGKVFRNSRKISKTEEVVVPDRKAKERPSLTSRYIAPGTDTEKRLAELIGRLLGIDKIGIEDAFFELGGDSLKGTLLLKHIRKEFEVEMPLKELFENQTVRKMGHVIDELSSLLNKQTRSKKTII